MSEAEWLTCDDPIRLVNHAKGAAERNFRLFGCACVQRALRVVPGAHYQAALDVAAKFADGEVSSDEIVATETNFPSRLGDNARFLFWGILSPTTPGDLHAIRSAIYSADVVSGVLKEDSQDLRHAPVWSLELAKQCDLFRDIFGNPFRPVVFDPEWRTSTAVALAKQMYESRDFTTMPILADALQDAGCVNEDILTHCRGDGPHVRGCWLVDLVLGKE